MRDYIEHCSYCIGKAIEKEDIDENEFPLYDEEPEAYKRFKQSVSVLDNHGIFVFFACEDCLDEQKAKFDPVIFNDYSAYERKVADYGERFEEED